MASDDPEWIIPSSIPFDDLKGKDLEECVYWLLDAMGAQDIEWRIGGSGGGAADGGRDGWVLTFYNNYGALDYCASCYDPDGRELTSDASKRIDTDPAELLIPLERQQLEALLAKI